MPLYEYKCGECGHSFETLVSMSAADEAQVCPSCGSKKSERKLSLFSSGSATGSSSTSAGCGGASPFT